MAEGGGCVVGGGRSVREGWGHTLLHAGAGQGLMLSLSVRGEAGGSGSSSFH